MASSRQLAAIMFTDIVGYTALMQQDEKKALKTITHFRQVLENTAGNKGGKIIQYYGDGSLLAFKTTSEAIEYAISLQKIFRQEPRVPVRIGLHLGEVIFDNENVFGDGVNVASRIESMGVPGSILLSKPIRDQVKNRSEFKLIPMGFFDFKNVEESMEIFAVSDPDLVIPKPDDLHGKFKEPSRFFKKKVILFISILLLAAVYFIYRNYSDSKKSEKITNKSIAVLPFQNLSEIQEQDYFIDGLTEDIIDRLAGIKNLRVISRTSVMSYKNSKLSIPQIAKELGVKYILEGSVRKNGNNIRVVAQLIDAETDNHLWSTSMNKAYDDIFQIQTDIAGSIAQYLKISLSENEKGMLINIPTENIEAYDLYLRGKKLSLNNRVEDSDSALVLLQEALNLDPEYADAMAALAIVYWTKLRRSSQRDPAWLDSAFYYANNSVNKDPENALGFYALGVVNNNRRGTGSGMPYFLKSSKLGYPPAYAQIGAYYLEKKDSRPDSAYFYFKKGLGLDPNDHTISLRLGDVWYALGLYDSAKYYYDKSFYLNPDQIDVKYALVRTFIHFRKLNEGIRYIRTNLLNTETDERILETSLYNLAQLYAFKGQFDSTKTILLKTKNFQTNYLMCYALYELNEEREAEKLEKSIRSNIDTTRDMSSYFLSLLDKNYDKAVRIFIDAEENFLPGGNKSALLDHPLSQVIEDREEVKTYLEKISQGNRLMIQTINENKIRIE